MYVGKYLNDDIAGAGDIQAFTLAKKNVREGIRQDQDNIHSARRSFAKKGLVTSDYEWFGPGDVVGGSRLGGGRLIVLTPYRTVSNKFREMKEDRQSLASIANWLDKLSKLGWEAGSKTYLGIRRTSPRLANCTSRCSVVVGEIIYALEEDHPCSRVA